MKSHSTSIDPMNFPRRPFNSALREAIRKSMRLTSEAMKVAEALGQPSDENFLDISIVYMNISEISNIQLY